jgi:hypothetical protein
MWWAVFINNTTVQHKSQLRCYIVLCKGWHLHVCYCTTKNEINTSVFCTCLPMEDLCIWIPTAEHYQNNVNYRHLIPFLFMNVVIQILAWELLPVILSSSIQQSLVQYLSVQENWNWKINAVSFSPHI